MIGCLWTRVRKQPIIALYFESETVLKFYNLEARSILTGYLYLCSNVNRGSYMSSHVSLNLINELRKRDKMRGLQSILFNAMFNKFIKT